MTATYRGHAWSCSIRLVVDDPRTLTAATQDLLALLDRVDAAASRFRSDSALSLANRQAGRPTPVPALLVDLVGAALDAARKTAGAVDPTLGRTMQRIGYDRDIGALAADDRPAPAPLPTSGRWRAVRLHREAGLLTVPAGTALDLGATAKAWTADEAARTLARRYETAVLVELGGDLAVAGARPGGWCIRVAEREGEDGPVVILRDGGITTSTTVLRRWKHGGAAMHHIVDPGTGLPVAGPWRTVTVAASSALAANIASTAAIVHGTVAVERLTAFRLAARLIGTDGRVVTTPGWPAASVGSPEEGCPRIPVPEIRQARTTRVSAA